MSTKHLSKTVSFNGRDIEVHEVTVAQVEAWEKALGQTDTKDLHMLDRIMGKSMPISGVRLCVPELTDDDLGVAPSEIAKLYDAVEEVNPFFLEYVERMAKLGGELMAIGGIKEKA